MDDEEIMAIGDDAENAGKEIFKTVAQTATDKFSDDSVKATKFAGGIIGSIVSEFIRNNPGEIEAFTEFLHGSVAIGALGAMIDRVENSSDS